MGFLSWIRGKLSHASEGPDLSHSSWLRDAPVPPALPLLSESSLFGHFRIDSLLGQGGMAQVFRAYDQRDGRCVALKIPLPKWQQDTHFREVFARETEIASRLDHPNIVTSFESGSFEEQVYLAMEMVEGVTLEDILFHGPLRFEECRHLARQLVSVLYYAHRRGLIHGDVKPANLLLNSRGFLKIVDFGVVAHLETLGVLKEHSSYTLGTPAYMAPEVLRGERATPLSDQFAAGVVLYETLTGRLPFAGSSPLEVGQSHQNAHVQSLVALRRGLPAAWEVLVLKMLSKEPEKRFSNLGHVSEQLMRNESGWA